MSTASTGAFYFQNASDGYPPPLEVETVSVGRVIGVRKPGAAESVLVDTAAGTRRLPTGVVIRFLEGVGVEQFLDMVEPCPSCAVHCRSVVPSCWDTAGTSAIWETLFAGCSGFVADSAASPMPFLPGNVCAYRDMSLETVEEVVEAGSPSEGERHLDPPATDGRRVARRVLRAFDQQMRAVIGWLPPRPWEWPGQAPEDLRFTAWRVGAAEAVAAPDVRSVVQRFVRIVASWATAPRRPAVNQQTL